MTIKELLEKSDKVKFGVICIREKCPISGTHSTSKYYRLPEDLEKLISKHGDCEVFNFDIEVIDYLLHIYKD
jgi:hypothetical protein